MASSSRAALIGWPCSSATGRTHLVSADLPVHRFSEGRIPEDLVPECEQLVKLLRAIGSQVTSIAAALKEPDDVKLPTQRKAQSHAGVELRQLRQL